MKRAAVITLVFLAATAGWGSPPVRAAPETDEPEPSLTDLWRLRQASLEEGNVLAADEAEAALRERRRRNGIGRSEDLAGVFVIEGYEQLALRHYSEAREAFHLATEFDPDMARAFIGLAETEWASGGGVKSTLTALVDAATAAARDWHARTVALHVMGWGVLAGVPLAIGLLAILLFLRTLRLVHHRLAEVLARRGAPATATLVAIGLPFLPFALPWGAAWTPLLWLALAYPFLPRRDRGVVLVALPLAALCGVLAPPAARFTAQAADPRLVHVAGAARGAVGPDRLRTLEDLLARRPDDAVLQLLVADQARGLGDYATALQGYRRAAEIDPSLRQAHNNAGTLYFSVGHYATALQHFRKAIDADPRDMTAYYNLYLTQEQRFDFAAAEQTLSSAQSIDLQRMTALLSEREKRQGRLDVLEDTVPVSLALEHARAAAGIAAPSFADARRGWPFAVLPATAAVLALILSRSSELPVQCPSCGRIACRHCALNFDREKTCASCVALAARSTALPRRARELKRREIAAYRSRQLRESRLLALVVPGGGQIWSGRSVTGTLLLLGGACAVAALLLRNRLPVLSYAPVADRLDPTWLAGIALLVMFWAAGWLLPRAPLQVARGR